MADPSLRPRWHGSWWWDGSAWRSINPSAPYPQSSRPVLGRKYTRWGCGLVAAYFTVLLPLVAIFGRLFGAPGALIVWLVFFLAGLLGMYILRLRQGTGPEWGVPMMMQKALAKASGRVRAAAREIPGAQVYSMTIEEPLFIACSAYSRTSVLGKADDLDRYHPPSVSSNALGTADGRMLLFAEMNPWDFGMSGGPGQGHVGAYHCVAQLVGRYAIPEVRIVPSGKNNNQLNATLFRRADRESTSHEFNEQFMLSYKGTDHPVMEPHVVDLIVSRRDLGYRYCITGSLVIVTSSVVDTDLRVLWEHARALAAAIPEYLYT